jgi:hypothetical protein
MHRQGQVNLEGNRKYKTIINAWMRSIPNRPEGRRPSVSNRFSFFTIHNITYLLQPEAIHPRRIDDRGQHSILSTAHSRIGYTHSLGQRQSRHLPSTETTPVFPDITKQPRQKSPFRILTQPDTPSPTSPCPLSSCPTGRKAFILIRISTSLRSLLVLFTQDRDILDRWM